MLGFLIFLDIDISMDVTSSVLLKFADDTKVAGVVESEEQHEVLQSTIIRLREWPLLFNSDNCDVLHLGGDNAKHV